MRHLAVLVTLAACAADLRPTAVRPRPGAFQPQFIAATSKWQAAAVSDDGKLVLLGDQHGTVIAVDADRGRILAALEPHTEDVVAIQIRSHTTAVSASRDGSACTLDLERFRVIRCASGAAGALNVAAFTHDGAMLAGGGSGGVAPRTVAAWNAGTGERLFAHEASASDIGSVAWSRDGAYVVAAGHPAQVYTARGARVRELEPADHVTFTDSGLVVAARDGVFRAWNPSDEWLVHERDKFGRDPRVRDSTVRGMWGYRGASVLVLVQGRVHIVDVGPSDRVDDGDAIQLLGRDNDRVDVVAISTKRSHIVTASQHHTDFTVWNARGRRVARHELERAATTGGTITSAGVAMLGSADGVLSIDLATGSMSRLRVPTRGAIVDVSSDGRFAIAREEPRDFHRHDAATTRLFGITGPAAHYLRDVSGVSPRFACAGGPGCWLFDGLVLVDAATGEGERRMRPWAADRVAALSADGRRIAVGATFPDTCRRTHKRDDCYGAIVSNATNGAVIGEVRTRHPVGAVALSDDGGRLLVAEGDYAQKHDYGTRIHVIDVATGAELRTIHADKDGATALAFSADGKRFLAGGGNHRDKLRSRGTHGSDVILVDIATGATVHRLRGHRDRITSVSFARDGKHALSVSADGTARLWNLATRTSQGIAATRNGWLVYDRDGQLPTL